MLEEQLRKALSHRKDRGILRQLTTYDTSPTRHHEQNIFPLHDFSSNDYIGLARSQVMRDRYLELLQCASSLCIGSTGSRLLDGNSSRYEGLEERLARHFGSSDALLFNSGYDANSSLLSVLPQPEDYILYDELAHASMHEGMRTSRTMPSRRIKFAHNDVDDFQTKVALVQEEVLASGANVFVAAESVYSMDGDICPLVHLLDELDKSIPTSQRCFILDEAHAVGLYGVRGAGLADEVAVRHRVDIRLATFGKAFGGSGAVVLGSTLIKNFLINYARPLIYSTALPQTCLLAIEAALDILSTPEGILRAQKTFSLTKTFILRLNELGISSEAPLLAQSRSVGSTMSDAYQAFPQYPHRFTVVQHPPIVPILCARPRELASHLIARGFLVRAIAYPTVPRGKERVRVCIHSHNEVDEVETLARCISEWYSIQTKSGPLKSSYGDEKAKL